MFNERVYNCTVTKKELEEYLIGKGYPSPHFFSYTGLRTAALEEIAKEQWASV